MPFLWQQQKFFSLLGQSIATDLNDRLSLKRNGFFPFISGKPRLREIVLWRTVCGGGEMWISEASLESLRNISVFSEMDLEMLHDFIRDSLELYKALFFHPIYNWYGATL